MTVAERRRRNRVVHTDRELDAVLEGQGAGDLVQLGLEGGALTEPALLALADRTDLPSLRSLSISGRTASDDLLGKLADSPLLARLELLHVDRAGLGQAGLRALAAARQALALRVLVVANRGDVRGVDNTIDDRGLEALAHSLALPRLETLDVSNNPVTVRGLQVLSASPHLPALREVTAWATGLTAPDRPHLAALRFRVFSDFDLRHITYADE
jgi:hypothetical protein